MTTRKSLRSYWGEVKPETYVLPKEETAAISETGGSYVYGEISEEGLVWALDQIPIRRGKFVDLGSGRGNVVAFVAHNYRFSECHGVELSERRHQRAKEIFSAAKAGGVTGLDKAHLHLGDMFDFDLSDADVVVSDNLVFSPEGITRLFLKAAKEMRFGTYFISMKMVPDLKRGDRTGMASFSLVASRKVRVSWSESCPLHVYRMVR